MYVCMYVLTFMSIHNQRGDYSSESVSGLQHAGTEYTRTQHTHTRAHTTDSAQDSVQIYIHMLLSADISDSHSVRPTRVWLW